MATKENVAKTISDEYDVNCKVKGKKWTVDGKKVIGSKGAKELARKIYKENNND